MAALNRLSEPCIRRCIQDTDARSAKCAFSTIPELRVVAVLRPLRSLSVVISVLKADIR